MSFNVEGRHDSGRPPHSRGMAKHIRMQKAAQRRAQDALRYAPTRTDLDPRTKARLEEVRRSASADLARLDQCTSKLRDVYDNRTGRYVKETYHDRNEAENRLHAELSLQKVWAQARLDNMRPATVTKLVTDLGQTFLGKGNPWLVESIPVGQNQRGVIPRYRRLLDELEASLPR